MYGSANVPGASVLEVRAVFGALDRLVNQLVAGEVTAPMDCQDGTPVTTHDGMPVLARRSLVTRQDTGDLLRAVETVSRSVDDKISAHNASDAAHPTHISVR